MGTLAARALAFDERYRFDTFVEGASTRDAAEAARVVADAPGARWNPLIVAGGPGLGKTHLLGAIARRARDARPSLRVGACTASDAPPAAPSDLLLVDDAPAGGRVSPAVRDAIDAAVAGGRQVVIAEEVARVDREEAGAWVARYPRARLVHVGAPDADARLSIVRAAAEARHLPLAPDALAAIAREPVPSVRELLGRLTRAGASHAPAELALGADTDFASFLDEVAREVEAHVEPWRVRLGEAASRWRAEGLAVDVIERALRLPAAPDVDALLATYERAVARLRRLEADAVAADPSLAGHDAFRDPARVADAERLARAAAAKHAPTPRAAIDPECWVLEWPDVRDLLIEGWG